MPEGEVQAGSEVAPDQDPLALSSKGRERLDERVQDFRKKVQDCSRTCAENAGLDTISAAHVDQAYGIVCQMEPQNHSLRVNPHIWSLLAGICFAVGLAIPDVGSLFLGPSTEDNEWAWRLLTQAFVALVLFGLLMSAVAFLVALGPYQPKWFKSVRTALTNLAYRRPR